MNATCPQPAERKLRNILFIMADQLRADYLSCYGQHAVQTPHIDMLARRGTRFENAYVQAPVCGPSRMSTYTGRYVASHGATWNFVPLPAGIPTMGDHLRAAGLRVAVVGKTHVAPDREGMLRMGLDPMSEQGRLRGEGGFEPFARHDGTLPEAKLKLADPPYNRYLKGLGYEARNAWHDFANSAVDGEGQILSGWQMRHSRLPARVADAHSETAWTTDQAIDFMKQQGEAPWCLHVSYIKPHWPYIVSDPYHAMYSAADIPPAVRTDAERQQSHPVVSAFRQHPESVAFSQDVVRNTVVPTYMGLVKQLDDHVGRLLKALEDIGRSEDTLVVLTSDHGDLLGDHWLGEKEMFYETSVRVPLIMVDPRSKAAGTVEKALVESIDLLPTFMEAVGLDPGASAWLEGHSLFSLPREPTHWREAVFSELDYAFYAACRSLALGPNDARATMVRNARWKYVHFKGFPPQLFDLQNDPQELLDQGSNPALADVRGDMERLICNWRAQLRSRTSMSDAEVIARGDRHHAGGVRIGEW